ncbi:MAG: hypothetical protein Q9188_005058 [Gyalolechia gomerana]
MLNDRTGSPSQCLLVLKMACMADDIMDPVKGFQHQRHLMSLSHHAGKEDVASLLHRLLRLELQCRRPVHKQLNDMAC